MVVLHRALVRGSVDKSLARPTFRCRTMGSTVSLERGVCSCAELQVFSCYRGWKEACLATRAISRTSRRELSSSSPLPPPARQGAEGNSRHSERNIWGTCTIVCHRQNWVAKFKRGDFSTCNAPCPGRHKTLTTPEITNQINELILEDRRISAKSIAEQLDISRERVGSIIYEDLDMRKLPAKWVPKCLNGDQKRQRCQSSEQNLEFFRRDPNDFLSLLMAMDETWLYHYDPETKQQSMKWRLGGSPRPKKFRLQKSAGKFLVSIFFEIKTASSSLIIFQRAKLSMRSITHICWCNWRTFWGKNAAGKSSRGSCSFTTMPRLTGHLQPRRNWPTWASNVLTTHPILRIWPRRTTTCSLDWKTIER